MKIEVDTASADEEPVVVVVNTRSYHVIENVRPPAHATCRLRGIYGLTR